MFNQCSFIGNLAADPESRTTQSSKQVASFTLCCDSGWGEGKRTEYVRCVAWDKLAGVVVQYLRKGSKCFLQGEMQTRKWQDKDGNDRYTTEIVAREMKMLSAAGERQPTPMVGTDPMVDDDF
jgi:single-strand DNA-binding protein